MIVNKYDHFFESVKSFVLETHLAHPEDLQGLPQDQVLLIEKRYGISLPSALRSYLSYFGKQFKMLGYGYELNFTQKMIDYVMKEAEEEEHEVLLRIIDQPSIENVVDHKQYQVSEVLDLSKILLTSFIDHNGIFDFIECKDENPMVQHFEKLYDEKKGGLHGYGYHPGEWSFIGLFRHLLFESISWKFFDRRIMEENKEGLEKYDRMSIDKLEWSKYYLDKDVKDKWYNIKDEQRRNFYKIKQEFSKKMDVQTIETSIIMTVDEFEWAFLEHLRILGVNI